MKNRLADFTVHTLREGEKGARVDMLGWLRLPASSTKHLFSFFLMRRFHPTRIQKSGRQQDWRVKMEDRRTADGLIIITEIYF
jgi:hypothetical protein